MSDTNDSAYSDDSLEDGLRAAFDRTRTGSVLRSLEERTHSILRLTLPDADEQDDPVVKPVGPEGRYNLGSRYQALGEIARGGLGVVMKTRDMDLGRDVAVKVLHERFKDDRQVIERFVEEAQIGGQLQHPGIVPVYELGLQGDDRPFFAMKLVKGETLAAMLRKRRDPAEDQQRFLRIFLQMCQTVAYAHVRRVVHRDLKPSNVLVGAFGEVQVVDWGLAKVMRGGGVADEVAPPRGISKIETVRTAEGSTHSIAGSVMGTPAYMPPEQARGEVERMDRRSDVFSLGAILCEMLSGAPPYDDASPSDALRAAAECRLDPALRRLAECGADRELIELTRACLAPSQDARPQDASEVAQRVEAYQQSVDDRARRAEVRAAELRVRTRSYLVLAAVVLIASISAGVAYLGWSDQRRTRQLETEQRAGAAILEATRHAGQAEQAGLDGLPLWESALAAARRAEEIVATGDASDALEAQTAKLVDEVERGEARTRAEASRERAHDQLLDRLREVRIGSDLPRIDLFQGAARRERESTRRRVEYATLFEELGFDRSRPVEEMASLFDCAHRERWALALDAWAEAERVAFAFDAGSLENVRALVRTARRIDAEDAWRSALRDELGREAFDVAALRMLARSEVLRDLDAEEVAIVVALLDAAGDAEHAVRAQRDGLLRHPSDYWLNQSFHSLCSQEELLGRVHGELVNWTARSAVVLRPDSLRARFGLAWVLFGQDDLGGRLLTELRAEAPDDPVLQSTEFQLLMHEGRFAEAESRIAEVFPALRAMTLDRDYANFLLLTGNGELLLDSSAVSVEQGFLNLVLDRPGAAWDVFAERRVGRTPNWPWLFLPGAFADVRSADELRTRAARVRSLAGADDEALRDATSTELLAASELVATNWDGLVPAVRLFERAFEKDPRSREQAVEGTRARQVAAFRAALASGMGTRNGERLPRDERAELRRLALGWLYEELDAIELDLSRPDCSRELATRYSRVLNQMVVYGWLAPIRAPHFLDEMEPDEAHECRVFWSRVRALEALLVHLFAA